MIRSKMWRLRSRTKREFRQSNSDWFSQESSWKMAELWAITTFKRNRRCIWCWDYAVVPCKYLSRHWRERPSHWTLSQMTRSKMSRRRSRTKREFLQSNSDWSLLANNWKMAELWATTTSKRSPPYIWCCDYAVVPCKSSLKRWRERPLLWMSNQTTRSKMSRQRSRTRKVSHLSNSD